MQTTEQEPVTQIEDRRSPSRRAEMEDEATNPKAARAAAIAELIECDKLERAGKGADDQEQAAIEEVRRAQQKLAAIRSQKERAVLELEQRRRRATARLFRTCPREVERTITMLIALDQDYCAKGRPVEQLTIIRTAREQVNHLLRAPVLDPLRQVKAILAPLGLKIPDESKPASKLGPENDE